MSWGDMLFGSKKHMSKLEMIKKLEYMVAFQANCLENGDWENFDKLQNNISVLENRILNCNSSENN